MRVTWILLSLVLLLSSACVSHKEIPLPIPVPEPPKIIVVPQDKLMSSEEKKAYAIGTWCVSATKKIEIQNSVPIVVKDEPAKQIKIVSKHWQVFSQGMKCDLSNYGWLEGIGYTDEYSLGAVIYRYTQKRPREAYTDCPSGATGIMDFGEFLALCDPLKADRQREIGARLRQKEEKSTVEEAVKDKGGG